MLRSLAFRIGLPCLALLTAFGSGCIEKRRRPKGEAGATEKGEVGDALSHLVTGERYRVTVDDDDPAKGAEAPLVTIVEFSDFECPACRSLVPNLEAAFEKHQADVKLVFKQYPLKMHPRAEPAARAALAAHRQGKFWPMHDLLFENQKALGDAELTAYATQLGLDAGQFAKDLADPSIAKHVLEETAQGTAMDVSSTPTFFVNGRLVRGAVGPEQIETILDEEIALARRLMAAGAERGDIYAHILQAADKGADPAPVPQGTEEHRRGEASVSTNYAVPTGDGRPSRGPDDALVTIVEFAGFKCDECRKVQPVLRSVLAKHPDDVRLVFRHAPTDDKTDQDYARLAAAAHRIDKFWPVHDVLYTAEESDMRSLLTKLAAVGADGQQLIAAIQQEETADLITEDTAMLDAFRGEDEVPILFVNGRYVRGVPTVESLETLIAEEKAKAEKFVAAHGGKRGPGLYDEMRTTSEHTDTRGNVIVGWRGLDRAKAVEAGEPVGGRADAVAVDVDTEGLPVKGDPKKAKVTIVECSDFDCPYCKRALDTLAQIEKAYGDKVALYFRQNPLPMHQNAMPAHKAAVAAHAQGKFWAMHDKLFENQSARTEDEFVAFAKELGLDVDKFRKAYNDPETEATIKRDLDVCSKMGVSGVPAFFIDGQPIRGAQPFDNFKPLIDRALAGQVG